DGLLLHVFDIERPAQPIVIIEDGGRRLAAQHPAEEAGELDRIVNAEIETEPTERIVHVGGVTGEEYPAPAERRRHALVHVVEIAVHDRVGASSGKEALQPALRGVLLQRLPVALLRARGKEQAPETLPVIAAGDLEQRAPLLRIGEIIAGALRIGGIEREGGR